MAKAKQSAAARIIEAARNATKRGTKRWDELLPPEQRKTVLDLAARWRAGELHGFQLTDLHRSFMEETGVRINYSSFCATLKGVGR